MDTITLGEGFISRDFKNKEEIISAIGEFCESKKQKAHLNIYKGKGKYGDIIGIDFSNKVFVPLTIQFAEFSVKGSMRSIDMAYTGKLKHLNK